MTVESALAFSIFVIFIASLLSLFPILRGQSELICRLDAAAEAAAAVKYAVEDTELGESISQVDVSLLGSSVNLGEDVLIRVTYPKRAAYMPLGLGNFLITQQVCRRSWTGRSFGGEDGEEDAEEYGFIAKNGTVCHRDEHCTYLNPVVSAVSSADVPEMRNRSRAKYYACSYCGGEGETVYITAEGNRFHSCADCSRLKREYRKVKLSENTLPLCSKCGGE